MSSHRIDRINEEIQRELSALFRQVKDPRIAETGMVSIVRVDTTADLRYAKIYVSVLDQAQEKDVFRGLKSASGFLRRELSAALQLRRTPELQFIPDHSIWKGAQVLELLQNVERQDAIRGPAGDGTDPALVNRPPDTPNTDDGKKEPLR